MAFPYLIEAAPVASFAKDADGRYLYASPYLLEMMGEFMGPDWLGKTDADLWPPDAVALLQANDEAVKSGAGPQVFSRVMPSRGGMHTVLFTEFPLPDGDRRIGVGGLAFDVTEYSEAHTDRSQLFAVAENTSDSVVVTGLDGRITYVNPAFERVTGYARAEAIGQNPRLLSSHTQTAAFYEQMWSSLTAGRPWFGELTNRRKDGSLFIETAVITPVNGLNGEAAGYVAVKSDVTDERLRTADSAAAALRHALVLRVIRDVLPGATAESGARAICALVTGLNGVAAAQMVEFQLDGRALPISHVVRGRPDPPLMTLPYQVGRRLLARADRGPWVERWANRQGRAYDQLSAHTGPNALGYAPVHHSGRLVGLLVVESVDVANKTAIADLMPTITELANLAGVVIGPSLTSRADAKGARERVSKIIANRAFLPVFQPIVDIVRNRVVGYEALTRFTDGSDPEVVFAEATAVHLGVQLEAATMKAAVAASKALPAGAWLNLNASPEFIVSGGQLRSLISGVRRPIVVEVTEHEFIVDYPKFRAAIATLGPRVRLAVDDAGVGFASLRHIVELNPAFIKLDRWLVGGLESDEVRQAMIAGLRYFSRKTDCRLIAEGVETDSEIAILRSLEISLCQGYALGRPRALDVSPVLVAAEA